MELPLDELYYETSDTFKFYSWEKLINFFEDAYKKHNTFLFFLKENDYKNEYGFKKSPYGKHNPLIWEAAHPIFFMEKHCLRYITEDEYPRTDIFINDIYDSFNISLEDRFKLKKIDFTVIEDYHKENHDKIISFIKNKKENITNSQYYFLMFVLLHHHMHLESFLFTNQLVYKENPFKNEFNKSLNISLFDEKRDDDDNIICNELEFVKIQISHYSFNGFYQGYKKNSIYFKDNKFHFDNESNSFFQKIENFQVSKTLITNYMYLKFLNSDGYKKNKYWSIQGQRWKDKTFTIKPIYWNFNSGEWYVNYFDTRIKLKEIYNYPVIHISYYEAEAYCNWAGGRLPKESEWEYLSSNGGTTLYPWGNQEEHLKLCNINYDKYWVSSVNDNPKEISLSNKNGVEQLIGNCWEWCSDVIYPYKGFDIDPLYREMSYPFFGFKKICRGGAWCVPEMLITSTYRNAQMPDCNIQYIGFRLVKDL